MHTYLRKHIQYLYDYMTLMKIFTIMMGGYLFGHSRFNDKGCYKFTQNAQCIFQRFDEGGLNKLIKTRANNLFI